MTDTADTPHGLQDGEAVYLAADTALYGPKCRVHHSAYLGGCKGCDSSICASRLRDFSAGTRCVFIGAATYNATGGLELSEASGSLWGFVLLDIGGATYHGFAGLRRVNALEQLAEVMEDTESSAAAIKS